MTPPVGYGELTRREAIRAAGAGGAILTLPGLLAACSSDGSSDGDTHGVGGEETTAEIESITWALPAAPATLDIATGYTGPGVTTMVLGLEGLVGYDEDLKLKPVLAEEWSQPDPLHYVYQIRSGVTFWDGTPMTIDDVVFSLARHLDPKSGSQLSRFFINVKSVKATGDSEVTVSLKQPDPLFAAVPAVTFVTPKAYSERLGKKLGTPGPKVNTMGTGPYEITSFSTDDGITLRRRSDYWGEKPRVQAATLKYIGDPQTQLLAVRSGDIDGVFDFPLGQGRQWGRSRGVNTEYVQGMGVVFLAFNMEAPPWDDVHVRRAIAHAADRAGYVRAFLAGHGRPATSLVSPVQWANVADAAEVEEIYSKIPKHDFDIEAAKAELAQSAQPDGFTASLMVPDTYPEFGKAMVSLSEALKEIGITLRVKQVPLADWLAPLRTHEDLGMSFIWYGPERVDPATFPTSMFDSKAAIPNGSNLAHYKNARIDRLLREQAATTDNTVRARAIGEMLITAGEQLPYLPLWWNDHSLALREGYVFNGFKGPPGLGPPWLGLVRARA